MSINTERKMEKALEDLLASLEEFIEDSDDIALATEESGVSRVDNFVQAGILTHNRGLVVRLNNGAEFQVTIVQSRLGDDDTEYVEEDEMALVDTERCESCGREKGQRHKVTTKRPSLKTMERWVTGASASMVEATDGCQGVDPDGECEHGHRSWLIQAGLI